MEDLEDSQGAPATSNGNEPQGNQDPQDPLKPDIEEEDTTRTPPLAEPTADMETREEDGADPALDDEDGGDDNDGLDSDLEELDDAEFDNFDASALKIPDQPLQVDESNVALLGVHKRKRTAEEEAERERKKKKKDRKREKPKRRKVTAGEDEFEGGEDLDGKRSRRSKVGPDGRPAKVRRAATPENEENLTPEERESLPII